MSFTYRKMMAIKKHYEETIGKEIPETPGIYIWKRFDASINKTYFYVGQARNLRNRRFDYYKLQTGLSYPTRHFEASLKAHKDWNYDILCQCKIEELDELEKHYIRYYMSKDNYITRNDSLTGSDITKTNANRITKIKKEYANAMAKLLNKLELEDKGDYIVIRCLKNKDGSSNKPSYEALRTLKGKITNEI